MYDCLGIKVFPWKLCQSKNGVCDESPPKRWTVAETFALRLNVHVTSDGIHAEIHEIWTCVAPAAPPLFHAAVNPCLQGESPWNWSCNSVNLRKSTVTWMRRHYVFTVISRWSTFSFTVNFCNINCAIFSDTHCSFGPPIFWHSPFHAGVSVY